MTQSKQKMVAVLVLNNAVALTKHRAGHPSIGCPSGLAIMGLSSAYQLRLPPFKVLHLQEGIGTHERP